MSRHNDHLDDDLEAASGDDARLLISHTSSININNNAAVSSSSSSFSPTHTSLNISPHFSADVSHPKRLAYFIQYLSSIILLIYSISLPFFPRIHLLSCDSSHFSQPSQLTDSGFGRTWFAFLLIFLAVHQFFLAYSSTLSLSLTHAQHKIEYYEHTFLGVVAWIAGGLAHISKLCLLWEVMRTHGDTLGAGTLMALLCSFFILLLYFFYAFRSSLEPIVAAITIVAMNTLLALALLHASTLNHIAPDSAVGAAFGFIAQAILAYPMMCMPRFQSKIWLMEVANILIWSWIVLCYKAFDNCAL